MANNTIEVNGRIYAIAEYNETKDNQYRPFNDGWFTYFVNTITGKRKFHLDEGDECIDPFSIKRNSWMQGIDDFKEVYA